MKLGYSLLMVGGLTATMLTGTALAQDKPQNQDKSQTQDRQQNQGQQHQEKSQNQERQPVAGMERGVVGVTVEEVVEVAKGWSVKKQILGKAIYNENNEKVGKIDDVIATPDKALSYAIVGTGGFVGTGHHDVAIPIAQLKMEKDKMILNGATKDAIKALPEFQYSNSRK